MYNFSYDLHSDLIFFLQLCTTNLYRIPQHMPDLSHYLPITNPTLVFFAVLCVILFAPIIMGRLRIPHIIGMVLAGVVMGKYGFNILVRDSSFELFGKVGLYYIMFLAGLEMDMEGLKKNSRRVLVFGLLTFFVPFIVMYLAGIHLLGYSIQASLLIGILMASNTLIAYPIVGRYGLQRHKSVTLSVGSSMVSLFLALVMLAALVGAAGQGEGMLFWLWFVVKFALFCLGTIWLIPRLARWFLRRYSDAVMQFIFILAVMFLCAALSEMIDMEGIFGAFFAGLVLNRFVPHVSPLMNRLEFTGNALFIPYFLIGVGMLIDVRLLADGGNTLRVMLCMVILGTLAKAIAAYLSAYVFRMPRPSGSMMFGLTSAHAAGAIAIVMVGMRLEISPGHYLVNADILNGVVIMILFTCIISTMVTEHASKQIILLDKSHKQEHERQADDEHFLIPVKYPETTDMLVSLGILMRNPKLNRGIVALNVVYDDVNAAYNQKQGRQLLDHVSKIAGAADVRVETQVRIATNIANGIKHAFKEFNTSEIIMGMHRHHNITQKFWGEFIRSLFNGLNRQIIIVDCGQPLNTIRKIQVAVPSRAEFEPGFYRWLERLARLAGNLECRITFHGRQDTLALITEYLRNRHAGVRAEYVVMEHWNELPALAAHVKHDHLFVVIAARKGTVSYKTALERLPDELTRYFSGKNQMIIFPDQYGEQIDSMTFTNPQSSVQGSAYEAMSEWWRRRLKGTSV